MCYSKLKEEKKMPILYSLEIDIYKEKETLDSILMNY